MNEIREFEGITSKEYGSIVANEIVVAFFGVELDGETLVLVRPDPIYNHEISLENHSRYQTKKNPS